MEGTLDLAVGTQDSLVKTARTGLTLLAVGRKVRVCAYDNVSPTVIRALGVALVRAAMMAR